MKPRRAEGIILYSRTTTHNAANWFVVELAGGDVRYTCMTSSGGQVRTLRVALSQSSWHDVAIRRLDAAGTHFLGVDNESVTLTFGSTAAAEVPRPLPMVAAPGGRSDSRMTRNGGNRTERSSFSGDDFITTATSELYIGGLPRPFYARLPPEVTSRDGFSGCLAAINLNGDTRTLRSRGVRLPDQFYNDVIEGCEGQKKIDTNDRFFQHDRINFLSKQCPFKVHFVVTVKSCNKAQHSFLLVVRPSVRSFYGSIANPSVRLSLSQAGFMSTKYAVSRINFSLADSPKILILRGKCHHPVFPRSFL